MGLFPLDQSIAFDGAYRVASGQVPMRDFLAPYGLSLFWLHGALFALFGTSYATYVAGAAAVNAVAVLLVFAILRRLIPGSLLAAACGAVLTAIWFYPQYGTPSGEHTAFFFCLVALCLAVYLPDLHGMRRVAAALAIGIALVLGFLGKQNAAFLFAPLIPVVIVLGGMHQRRAALHDLGWLAAGVAVAAGGLLVWLVASGALGEFARYYVELPAELGHERLAKIVYRPYETLIRVPRPMTMRIVLWAAVVAAATSAAALWSRSADTGARRGGLVVLAIVAGAVLIQNAFITTTFNHPTDGFVFAGLVVGAAGGLVAQACADLSRTLAVKRATGVAAAGLVVVATTLLSVEGMSASHQRRMHDVFEGSSFESTVDVPNLRYLRWGSPTVIKGGRVSAEDLTRLCRYLAGRGRFFSFPELTLLYGVLGVPSPQPLLWFHPGLTYLRGGDPALDRRIVGSLDAHGVDTVVIQRRSWFGTKAILADFPRLQDWLDSQFDHVGSIGMFDIYERRMVRSESR
jgi:hypothetical protein